MKTTALRTQDIEQKWYLMDCSGKKLGRLSVQVANILRGKNKPEYTPNSDIGDFVVLVNAKKIEVTGNKAENKILTFIRSKKSFIHTTYKPLLKLLLRTTFCLALKGFDETDKSVVFLLTIKLS